MPLPVLIFFCASALFLANHWLTTIVFPEVELKRSGRVVHIVRDGRLWLVFDPERDRLIGMREIGNYMRGTDRVRVVTQISGRTVRFTTYDDARLLRAAP